MLLAKLSDKGAVENKQNMRFVTKIGQVYRFIFEILQGKFRRGGV